MLFRIEDTDRTRHSEEAVTALINAMRWLELDWDGDIVSQFEQKNRHIEIAEELLDKNLAYRCYCTQKELEEMREKARKEGLPTFYDRRWRDSDQTPPDDIEPVIRIKSPLEGSFTVQDQVQGEITVDHSQLDDFIILRSDGTPTYMLAVVVDDHDMGVTHVIRGDDHINNTFRQNVIYETMGWEKPVYAHLPLIHGPDGGKMSKRHGAASVEEYRDMGYLPEAMRNYLLRLGWSHGDEEIISTERAIEWFDFDGIGKSPAKFDFAKLESVNAHYIKTCDPERLIALSEPFAKYEPTEIGRTRTLKGVDELKDRAKTLIQFAAESAFYHHAPTAYGEKTQKLIDEGQDILQLLLSSFSNENDLSAENVQDICKTIATDHADGKLGKIAMPLRAALTGTTQSPSVFEAAAILGKEETCARIQTAIN